jgi:hypothetical protein
MPCPSPSASKGEQPHLGVEDNVSRAVPTKGNKHLSHRTNSSSTPLTQSNSPLAQEAWNQLQPLTCTAQRVFTPLRHDYNAWPQKGPAPGHCTAPGLVRT